MELRLPEVEGISEIFSVLGDETRCRIVYLLSLEELCTCELAEILGITMPAVSHHLRILKALRLVRARPEGKHVFYALADDHILSLIRVAQEHYEEERQDCETDEADGPSKPNGSDEPDGSGREC